MLQNSSNYRELRRKGFIEHEEYLGHGMELSIIETSSKNIQKC